jgi:hypothetical protein
VYVGYIEIIVVSEIYKVSVFVLYSSVSVCLSITDCYGWLSCG